MQRRARSVGDTKMKGGDLTDVVQTRGEGVMATQEDMTRRERRGEASGSRLKANGLG